MDIQNIHIASSSNINQPLDYLKAEKKMAFHTELKGMLYILPIFILFAIFTIYPFIRTLVQSFYLSDNRGSLTLFVGIENYGTLFENAIYLKSLFLTIVYALITVPLTISIALVLAVLSFNKLKGNAIFNMIFASSMGISVAAGSVFWNLFFHPTAGFLNNVMRTFGLDTVGWLTSPNTALISISLATVWMNVGFAYLVLMGGLKNIDSAYYENVELIGGGFWYRLRKVTIPLLSPSLFFVFMTSIINAFQSFGVVDLLTQGGPANSTNLLVYSLYKEAFVNYQYGTASAQGIVLFIIICGISFVQLKAIEKKVTYQ